MPIGMVFTLVAAWAGVESVRPEAIDPDHHHRRGQLQERIAENPGRPVAVVIGSSRVALGFAPESLPNPASPVLWFNLAHFGSGPVMNHVVLSRLIDSGIRPDVVVFEVMPVFYVSESYSFLANFVTWRDLLSLHHRTSPFELDWCYVRSRATRVRDLLRAADPYEGARSQQPFGGPPISIESVTDEDRKAKIGVQFEALGRAAGAMEIRSEAIGALAGALNLCRAEGITPVLVFTPEGREFRKFYDPIGLAQFEEQVAEVARQHETRVIDARDWLHESDFMDSHHTLLRGTKKFTERLVAEVGFGSR